MGIIYEAFDRQQGITVALKTLRNATPDALFRFKQEFRALADVRHPNLVTLYELLCIDDEWLFTMELIDGVHLSDCLRPPEAPRPEPEEESTRTLDTQDLAVPSRPQRVAREDLAVVPVDFGEVRQLLAQLAMGIQAVHQTGHVHRDVKPSNVMVTSEGRVVLLDFGVIGVPEGETETLARGRIVGTPTYMSPEQMRGGARLSAADDWYSFGLVLYEALTGRRAFRGTFDEMLFDKLAEHYPAPSAINPAVPTDLGLLCRELLRAEPTARLSGPRILELLGGRAAPAAVHGGDTVGLVGRDLELSALERAFARIDAGEGGVVFVVGDSGMGKSSMVSSFVDSLERDREVVILAGRCHQHEAVPFKGVDRLVDELSRVLALMPPEQARALLPEDTAALTRVFPVLRRLEVVADCPPRYGSRPDPFELRRRAFAAMRELLARLAARTPTVLFIDDFQWTDPDSTTLLAELMAPPAVPPLLLVVSSRSEDTTMVELLKSKLPADSPWRDEVRLGPLDAAAARVLAEAASVDGAAADRLLRESGGNPYFLQELLRASKARRGDDRLLTLDEMLLERASSLPDAARSLLELIALAGKPTVRSVITAALGRITDEPFGIALDRVGGEQLIRSRRLGDRDLLEPYHDRIRESLVAAMPPERRRALHHALASAIQRLDSADVEALATHLEGAGQVNAAAEGYARAAAAAAETLAFDRAAELYRRSLELAPPERTGGAERVATLGDCLANAGRGAEAAEAYQRAVAMLERAAPAHPLVLACRARAAQEFLRSGRVDEGLDALRSALAPVGLTLPRHDLASLLWSRLRLRLRGTRLRPRPAEEIPVQELLRIELAASVAASLGNTAHIKGAVFQSHHLRYALRAGHAAHVARGLGFEAIFEALKLRPSRRRVDRLNAQASELAEQVGDPMTSGLVRGSRGLSLYYFGDWESCVADTIAASTSIREQCAGAWFEVNTIEVYGLWSLYYLGRLAELSRRSSDMLRGADARGDRYLVATLSTGLPNQAWLMRNDLQGARHAARESISGWSRDGLQLQHHWSWHALVNADLYAGDGLAAWRRVEEGWPALRRSLLLNIPMLRVEAYDLRARAALLAGAASEGAEREQLLARAHAATRKLRRGPGALGPTLVALNSAGRAELSGRPDEAVAALRTALEQAEKGRLGLHRAVITARLAALEESFDRRDEALAWMRGQGIADPRRFVEMVYPACRQGQTR